jgi:hypothetical protein
MAQDRSFAIRFSLDVDPQLKKIDDLMSLLGSARVFGCSFLVLLDQTK